MPEKTFVGLSADQPNEIHCDMIANPSSQLRYRWSLLDTNKNEWINFPLDLISPHPSPSSASASHTHSEPILRLINDRLPASGELRCEAENRLGISESGACLFSLVTAGPPGQLVNCSQSNLTLNSFTIQCTAGFSGGLQQTFHLEIWLKRLHEMTTSSPTTTPASGLIKNKSDNRTFANSMTTITVESDSTSGHISPNQLSPNSNDVLPVDQIASQQMFDFADQTADSLNSTTPVQIERLHSSTVGYRKLITKLAEREFRLIANLTSTDFPFFAVRSLPTNAEFQLILYSSNGKGRGKELHLSGNTLMAAHWQTG